jgi:hypothetical protein
MAFTFDAPMQLGQTLSGKDSDGNLIHTDKLGLIYEFPTFLASGDNRGQKYRPGGGRHIQAVLLRNTAGYVLLPGRLGLLDTTAGYGGVQNVIGYTAALAAFGVVVIDPFLGSETVADDDIFWGIIGGPVLCKTPIADTAFNGDIAVGAKLIAVTGTTTGATTSGRVGNASLANNTSAQGAFDQSCALVGRALSARTTGNTNADILVEVLLHRTY